MASLERKEPVTASPRNLVLTEWSRRFVAPPFRLFLSFKRFKVIEEHSDRVPRSGPVLLLANHVGFFDPVKLIFTARRTVHFLTSQATMTDAGLARVMQLFGQVPKQKGAADPKAIRGLQAWAKVGGAVGLFPEGERSWDGRQLELLPGIERLIRLMRIPVMTARIENADLVTPRWALSKRCGNMKVTYDKPRSFDKKANRDEIREWVKESIRVDPGNCWRAPVTGTDLALGLANLLYMCPVCGAVDPLEESGDDVHCRSCSASFRIDTKNLLHGASSTHALWELAPDLDRKMGEQVDAALDADPSAELLRSHEEVEALRLGDEVTSLGSGILRLSGDRLGLVNSTGEEVWGVESKDVTAMTVELVRRLQIFLRGGDLVELRVPRESVIKFKRAFDRLKAREKAAKKAKKSA